MGNGQTGRRTKTEQGHRQTGTGTQTDMDRHKSMDMDNLNEQLTKNKSAESVKF
jgi:hypothetical protein